MEIAEKLKTLIAAAKYDVCGYGSWRSPNNSPQRFIHRAALPNGGSVCLFKVLLTNICVNDCAYCVNQIGRNTPRTSFQPDELAKLFMELYTKRLAQGLFLSSGIGYDASRTMDSMLKTIEILRYHHQYKGYIHLKILPGASFDCVAEACKLANRVSVNIEAPTAHHLAKLSRKKDLKLGILKRMRWIKEVANKDEKLLPSGQTTQFVVGASGERDRDILHTTEALYREMRLRRVYYSAFYPVGDSRLEGVPPAPPIREHRLYQTDWLLRVYGFSPEEVMLAFDEDGNLPLTKDPKLAIAESQPWLFPLDINKASYNELIRVPGVGPTSAKDIIAARKEHSIFSSSQLKKLGVRTEKATPFIWFKGMSPHEKQLPFLTDPSLATV